MWSLFRQRSGRDGKVRLSRRALGDIGFWRALTLLVSSGSAGVLGVPLFFPLYARNPELIPADVPSAEVFVDACRSSTFAGIGVFVPHTEDWLFLRWPEDLGVVPHINTLELVALVLGFLLIRSRVPTVERVVVWNDSTAAAHWAANRYRHEHPLNYALVVLNAFAQFLPRVCLQEVRTVPPDLNCADGISRGTFATSRGRCSEAKRWWVGPRVVGWIRGQSTSSSVRASAAVRAALTLLAGDSSSRLFVQADPGPLGM